MRTVAILLLFAATLAAQRPPVETAWDLIAKGRRSEAVGLLRQMIKTDPRYVEARLLLGSILMEDGDRSGAIEQLSEAVRLQPKSAEAHNALGEAYTAFGDPKSARPEFEKALAVDPAFAQAHVDLGALLLDEGGGDAAAQHLDRAIQLLGHKPDAAYPLYLRAKIYSEHRDPKKAVSVLEKAVSIRPDFGEAWSDLGEARKATLDDAGALGAFERAAELSPQDAVAQTRLGSKLLEMGRAHDAIPHLEAAARLDSKNQSTLYTLERALLKDGQREQAAAVKQQLAELLYNKDKADQNLVAAIELNNRGAALEKSGDLTGAVEKYRAALALFPEHVGIRTNFAIALLKLGHWDEGISQMREALRREPGNAQLNAALEDALAQARAHGITVSKP